MARPKNEEDKPLTDTELQVMNALWEAGGGTVHEVSERLAATQQKDYAYTTVSTLLRILEKKGAVESQKEGRGHRYIPIIEKENYQRKATDRLVNHLFSGQPGMLICNLLGEARLSKEELKEVRKLLEEKRK